MYWYGICTTNYFIFLIDMPSSDEAKQQRIALLLHASICSFGSTEMGGEGQLCPTLLNCLAVKCLYTHIHECIFEMCDYPHCSSSKFIMSHFYY
jgi:hypothetical protein